MTWIAERLHLYLHSKCVFVEIMRCSDVTFEQISWWVNSHSLCRWPRLAPLAASSWTSCYQNALWLQRSYSSRTSPLEWSPACPWHAAHMQRVQLMLVTEQCVCQYGECVSYISELQLLSVIDTLHFGLTLRAEVVVTRVRGHQQHVCNTRRMQI